MSEAYLAGKLREALAAAGGSRPRAQRILMSWAQSDDQLMRELVSPFLKAIVTSAVDRAARAARMPAEPRRAITDAELDQALALMGRRAATGTPAPSGDAPPSPAPLALGTRNIPPPTKAGEQHVRTMKALAAVYRRRRDA